MKVSGKSQKNMAILLGVLSLGIVFFIIQNQEAPPPSNPAPAKIKSNLKKRSKTIKIDSSSDGKQQIKPNKLTETNKEVIKPNQITIKEPKSQKSPEVTLQEFKNLVELDFIPPPNLKFYNLELDYVEGIASHIEDEGVAIIAAPMKASIDEAIKFIKNDRKDFIFLNGEDFSKLGEATSIPAPVNSGISRITLIPGGESNGKSSYAAVAERVDGRGTYLFILKTSDPPNTLLPQISQFLGTLKTRK